MSGLTFIECDRIDLRTIEEEDVPFLHEGINHPEVRRYIGNFRRPFSEQRCRDGPFSTSTNSDGATLLAVPKAGNHEGNPVGSVELYPVWSDNGSANLGIWFHPDAWGHGYAIEASAHLIEYGFRALRLHRVSADARA